jgi:hypothetical protein
MDAKPTTDAGGTVVEFKPKKLSSEDFGEPTGWWTHNSVLMSRLVDSFFAISGTPIFGSNSTANVREVVWRRQLAAEAVGRELVRRLICEEIDFKKLD